MPGSKCKRKAKINPGSLSKSLSKINLECQISLLIWQLNRPSIQFSESLKVLSMPIWLKLVNVSRLASGHRWPGTVAWSLAIQSLVVGWVTAVWVKKLGQQSGVNLCVPVATNTSRRYLRSATHGDLLVPRTRTVTYEPRSLAVSEHFAIDRACIDHYARTVSECGVKTILFRLAYGTWLGALVTV